jgi:hypothetical protein
MISLYLHCAPEGCFAKAGTLKPVRLCKDKKNAPIEALKIRWCAE